MATIGPVEYVLITFPGTEFSSEIAPALADLVANRTVRILDLVFVRTDADGGISTFEYDELSEAAPFAEIDGDADGFLGEDDVAFAVSAMAPSTAAVLIVWEDLWAAPFAAAVRDSGGALVAHERIPHQIAVQMLDALGEAQHGAEDEVEDDEKGASA